MSIIWVCMDMMNQSASEVPPLQSFVGSCDLVVGLKQLKKALRNGEAAYVYLAGNADPELLEDVTSRCRECSVPYAFVDSMETLGETCGISVGAAAAAALK